MPALVKCVLLVSIGLMPIDIQAGDSQTYWLVLGVPFMLHVVLLFAHVNVMEARLLTHAITGVLWLGYFSLRTWTEVCNPWTMAVVGQFILWCFFTLRIDVELVWLWRSNKSVLLFFTIIVFATEKYFSDASPRSPISLNKPTPYYFVVVCTKISAMFAVYGMESIMTCIYRDTFYHR